MAGLLPGEYNPNGRITPTQDGDGTNGADDWFAQNGIQTDSAVMDSLKNGDHGPAPTGNTGVNGGLTAGDGMGAGGQNVRDQFISKLKAAWPQKSQDPNWLNQQADYFVKKSQSGETMGNGQSAPLSYWMDRASGMGASGGDAAETGQWAGGDRSASQGMSGNATNPYGDFSYQGLGSLGQFNAPPGSGTYQPFNSGVDALGNPTQVNAGQITPEQAQTQQAGTQGYTAQNATTQQAQTAQAQTAQAQTIMASPAYAQAGPAVQAAMLANPEKFGGVSEADMKADPSYAFRLSQGQGALENNNAARGLSRTGGAYKGLIDYGQNAASQEYQNVYNRKFGEFNNAFAQNYQVGATNASNKLQADTFNSGQTQQTNLANAGFQNNANLTNAGAQNSMAQFNAGAQNDTSRFNAGSTNSANQFNAGSTNSANQFNAGSGNQAAQFGAGAYNNASQFNAGAMNQGQQFNVGNNLNAQGQNVSNSLSAQNANNANRLAYQGQNYGQSANTYGLNQGAQNQAYNQALGTYGANLQGQNQGYTQALGGYNANVNAGLGYGNLGVSQGQLALGYGNLGLAQNRFGLDSQGQSWDQSFKFNNEEQRRKEYLANQGNPNNGGG